MARGEIDLRVIKVIVNGQHPFSPLFFPLVHVLFQQVSFDNSVNCGCLEVNMPLTTVDAVAGSNYASKMLHANEFCFLSL